MLSQFKKKTFCSDLDQRSLFRPGCPVINSNYGTFRLARFIYIVKAEKMPKRAEKVQIFAGGLIFNTKQMRKLLSSETTSKR